MVLSWVEALVSLNEAIIACEKRACRQCAHVVELAADDHVAAEEQMLLASYMISLTLIRAHRNALLADVPAQV